MNNTQSKDALQEFFENFNLKFFFYVFRRSIILIIALFIIFLSIPYLYVRYKVPIYETTGTIIKKKVNNHSILDDKEISVTKIDDEKIKRDIIIIKSDLMLNTLLDSLNLNVSYYKVGRLPFNRYDITYSNNHFNVASLEIYNPYIYNIPIKIITFNKYYSIAYQVNGHDYHQSNIPYDAYLKNKDLKIAIHKKNITEGEIFNVEFNDKKQLVEFIKKNVEVINDDPNIYFKILSHNQNKSELILSELISQFLLIDKNENTEKLESSIDYIDSYIDTLNQELKISQKNQTNFIVQNQVYSPDQQLTMNLSQTQEYKKNLMELQEKLYEVNALSKNIKSLKADQSFYYSDNPELEALANERAKLLLDYTPQHPTIIYLDNQIDDKIKGINQTINSEIKLYQKKIAQSQNEMGKNQSTLSQLPEKGMEFNKLDKEVNVKETYVLSLMNKKLQLLINKSAISSDYIVIDKPKTNPEPISPNKKLAYGSALLLFFISAFLIIIIRYLRFDKIINLDEVKKVVSAPILGTLPYIKEAEINQKNTNSPTSKLVVVSNPKSNTSELFKKMRASLRYTGNGDYKTVSTTSTAPGEGKTFVLINLAAVHAQLNKKVIVLDLDLRKPRISKSFDLDNSVGMSNILTSDISLDECIHKDIEIPNFDVITSGPIPPNPSELILSDKFKTVLEELKKRYDYVFIDSPPIGLVNESIEIVNMVDIPIYIVRFNYSKKEFLTTLKDVYESMSNKKLLLIINHYGEGASSYVNYSYGGYSYSYGYKYQDYEEKSKDYFADSTENKKENKLINFIKSLFTWKL